MSSYNIFLLTRCLRKPFRTMYKPWNFTLPSSTFYTLDSSWIRKTKDISPEFVWQHGISQSMSRIYVRSEQTAACDSISELVYEGQLKRNIKRLKILTLSTSIGAFALQPIVLSELWATNPYFTCVLGIFSTGFIMVTPLLIHLFSRRYVTELSFNPANKTFTATTLTLFIKEKKTTFTAEDVYVPTISGFFTTFLVNNTPMFVDSESVINIEAYQHLLGYDKPIDLYFEKTANGKKNIK